MPEGHPSIVSRSRLSAISQDDTDDPRSESWRILDKRSKEASKSACNDLKSVLGTVSALCTGRWAISFLISSSSVNSLLHISSVGKVGIEEILPLGEDDLAILRRFKEVRRLRSWNILVVME